MEYSMCDTTPPTREQADTEFQQILAEAARGQLGPADFQRADELLPHVSPELRLPKGRE
jgi:hypothetical protein